MLDSISKYLTYFLLGIIISMGIKIGSDYFTISRLEKDKENLQEVVIGMDSINRADAERAKVNSKSVLREYEVNNRTLKDKLEAINRAKQEAKGEDKCIRASIILDSAGF